MDEPGCFSYSSVLTCSSGPQFGDCVAALNAWSKLLCHYTVSWLTTGGCGWLVAAWQRVLAGQMLMVKNLLVRFITPPCVCLWRRWNNGQDIDVASCFFFPEFWDAAGTKPRNEKSFSAEKCEKCFQGWCIMSFFSNHSCIFTIYT